MAEQGGLENACIGWRTRVLAVLGLTSFDACIGNVFWDQSDDHSCTNQL